MEQLALRQRHHSIINWHNHCMNDSLKSWCAQFSQTACNQYHAAGVLASHNTAVKLLSQ